MMLCTNRPEGFGPLSHLYSHILTSCFLDTVLVPLCTWIYLAMLIAFAITGTALLPHKFSNALPGRRFGGSKTTQEAEPKRTQEVDSNQLETGDKTYRRTKTHTALLILYFLLVLAQALMCILEIVRLSLTRLGIGLLPFTLVALITAAAVRFTKGLQGRIHGWSYLNLALWISLAVTNGVKIAQETKEGTGARKGSKYPVADEITDVSVMIGVYAVLAFLEVILSVWEGMRTVH